MLPHHTDGQKCDVDKNRQKSNEQRPAKKGTVKQDDIDGKYASHQRKEQPCRENQQRQPEERALRLRIPEEDFAEEGLHRALGDFQQFLFTKVNCHWLVCYNVMI